MNDSQIKDIPKIHAAIAHKSKEIGFSMPSDLYIGTLLKTLVASKPQGDFLELGTGIGLSLSWMVDGMDADSRLTTIDNDPDLVVIAQEYFGEDKRVEIVCADGSQWIEHHKEMRFDLIFADAWPGKYSEVDEVLAMVKVGGFYVIDDMSVQPNWPEGHEQHVDKLVAYLEQRDDFNLTKMNWSTGLIIAARTN